MSIPHLFRCPISLDLFTDPVTLCTGQTYDRPSIEKWLADGNSTCPVTMQHLADPTLVPNHILRHLIDRWLLSGPEPNPTCTGTAYSLSVLKNKLQSPETGIADKLEILKKIRILSAESDIGQACLIQLGFFHHMLQILFHTAGSVEEELVEVALDCLLNLSPSTHLHLLDILKKESRLASFVLLLEQGNLRIKTGLCKLIVTIADSVVTRDLCVILGQSRKIVHVVVSLLHNRTDARAAESAARAVSVFCTVEANRANAVKEGAVDGLISYLANCGQGKDSRALAALEILVGSEAGKKALMKNPNAVKVLVKYVFVATSSMQTKDNEGAESAVGVLVVACSESGRARTEAVSAGVLTKLLLLLQSQCGSKAKANARALLKLLRTMWAKDPGMIANFYHFK